MRTRLITATLVLSVAGAVLAVATPSAAPDVFAPAQGAGRTLDRKSVV